MESIFSWKSWSKMLLLYQLIAKGLSFIARGLFRQAGQTWPGEIILKLNPHIARQLQPYFAQIVLVLGTNGKTTTTKFVVAALERANRKVIYNSSGANLLNGIVSSILIQLPLFNKKRDYFGVFEVDEYAFPEISRSFNPNYLIILNVYRDQLDRYGEVGNVLAKWKAQIQKLTGLKIIYQASDPALANMLFGLGLGRRLAFAVPQSFLKKPNDNVFGDYNYCERCDRRLSYRGVYLAHLGDWYCSGCGLAMPKSSFTFSPNELTRLKHWPSYLTINLESCYLLLKDMGLPNSLFWQVCHSFQPAFGRGETLKIKDKQYTFFLGKNPAGWSASLNYISNQHHHAELILGLNNRVPDGHDISWIWDTHLDTKAGTRLNLAVFGDRAYDLALRLKMENIQVKRILPSISKLKQYLETNTATEIVFLTNYSAMLESRRLITGRAIH